MGGMVRQQPCPECAVAVAVCDNGVRLDVPSEPWSDDPLGPCWTIMQLGGMSLASVGGPGADGRAHRLHEHQPPET